MQFINDTAYTISTWIRLVNRAMEWELKPSQREDVTLILRHAHFKTTRVRVTVRPKHKEIRVDVPRYTEPDWADRLKADAPAIMQAVALGCAKLGKPTLAVKRARRFWMDPTCYARYAEAARYLGKRGGLKRPKPKPPSLQSPRARLEARYARYELHRRRLRSRWDWYRTLVRRLGRRVRTCSQRMGEIRHALRKLEEAP